MAPGFFPASFGPIPTYLIAWLISLLIPPALILPRFWGKFRLPIWASMILFTILGWVLVNVATWLYFDYLWEFAEALPQGPEKDEAFKKWSADGASLTGAFYGGWIVFLFYYLSWLGIAWIVGKINFLKERLN